MVLENIEKTQRTDLAKSDTQDGVSLFESIFTLEGGVADLFSFVGIGPEINDLIEHADKIIGQTTDRAEKMRLLERRNSSLRELLLSGLQEIYGDDDGRQMAGRILERIDQLESRERVPNGLREKDNCFIVYPDTFGGIRELVEVVPTLSKLGITKIHLLPFFDHAGDAGYAIKYHSMEEPLRINPRWRKEDFEDLVKVASQHQITLLVDVVLNHMAITSPILDDPEMIDKLLLSWEEGAEPFELLSVDDEDNTGGTDAVVRPINSQAEERVLIMFPEQAGDNPLLVNYKGRSIYHTFYPFQLDLNFKNPAAFELISNIIFQVTEMMEGEGQIRLDAIPFVGKQIDQDVFQNMDGVDGFRIITLLRVLTALANPNVSLIAEASRPMSEIEKYLNRVGGAYDFISLPYLLLAIANDQPEVFFSKITSMIESLGLNGVEKLVLALQTHDDYPLAELRDPIAKDVWQSLKGKKAEPFGQVEGKLGTPKGAAVRLAEICNNDPDKLAATFAMTAFTPHSDLFFLYGTDIGLGNSQDSLVEESELAVIEKRKVDKRSVIRSHIRGSEYISQTEVSVSFSKISKILTARRDYLPEEITDWSFETSSDGITIVRLAGIKQGTEVRMKLELNYSDQEVRKETEEQHLLLSSSDNIEVTEAWGYRLYQD